MIMKDVIKIATRIRQIVLFLSDVMNCLCLHCTSQTYNSIIESCLRITQNYMYCPVSFKQIFLNRF